MDLLCLDSRKLGEREALISGVECEQYLKAKRRFKCLSAAATE